MPQGLGLIYRAGVPSSRYAAEVLEHAGLFHCAYTQDQASEAAAQHEILLLAGHMALEAAQKEELDRFVRGGGGLIAVGSSSGLESLLGVSLDADSEVVGGHQGPPTQLGEGYISVRSRKHPITSGLESSLHTFGGVAVRAAEGRSLARMRDGSHRPTDLDAVVVNQVESGLAVLIAPDLIRSVVHMQQGTYVDQDGLPAPDGTAPLNDGILKCEDGMVLDYEWDRTAVDGENPVFYHPIADELRELLLKSILYVAHKRRVPLPLLWYYPNNLGALGHISHDTDGNVPELGQAMLDVTRELDLRTTWCTIEPGYSQPFYEAIIDFGSEIATHYDALDGRSRTSWGRQQFLGQYDWLVHASGVKPVSNKNHYTRWEGRLEFFRWCVEAGIQCDQTKGPSKKGTIGYAFGGSHPWFPIDDDGTFIDCLELNMQTQDLVVTCPEYFGRYWVDQAADHHGIAHLLFHPAHIQRPGVADALRGTIEYGREKGLQWWTSEQVNEWERARRSVKLRGVRKRRTGLSLEVTSARPIQDATLLVLNSRRGDPVERYGFRFGSVVCDIEGETEVNLTAGN